MSAIKRYYEDIINSKTDDELLEMGFEQEEIDYLKECFLPPEEDEEES